MACSRCAGTVVHHLTRYPSPSSCTMCLPRPSGKHLVQKSSFSLLYITKPRTFTFLSLISLFPASLLYSHQFYDRRDERMRPDTFGELLQAASTVGDLRNCPVGESWRSTLRLFVMLCRSGLFCDAIQNYTSSPKFGVVYLDFFLQILV